MHVATQGDPKTVNMKVQEPMVSNVWSFRRTKKFTKIKKILGMTHQTHDHASKKKLCVDVSESFGLTIGTVGNYSRGN